MTARYSKDCSGPCLVIEDWTQVFVRPSRVSRIPLHDLLSSHLHLAKVTLLEGLRLGFSFSISAEVSLLDSLVESIDDRLDDASGVECSAALGVLVIGGWVCARTSAAGITVGHKSYRSRPRGWRGRAQEFSWRGQCSSLGSHSRWSGLRSSISHVHILRLTDDVPQPAERMARSSSGVRLAMSTLGAVQVVGSSYHLAGS
jgi:hypothetical protein